MEQAFVITAADAQRAYNTHGSSNAETRGENEPLKHYLLVRILLPQVSVSGETKEKLRELLRATMSEHLADGVEEIVDTLMSTK